MGFAASPISVIVVGGPIKYYYSAVPGAVYAEVVFGGPMHSLTIQNTHATDTAQFSFDGTTLHGDLSAGESITINVGNATSIYLRSTPAGTATIRVWAW